MNVPQIQHLHSQNFNSEYLEFVWNTPTIQVNFIVTKNGETFLSEKDISLEELNDNTGIGYRTSGIVTTKIVSFDELTKLKEETVKFLNE